MGMGYEYMGLSTNLAHVSVAGQIYPWFKDGAYFCYCTYIHRISEWSEKVGFLNNGAY